MRSSESLKKMFALILKVGNIMNARQAKRLRDQYGFTIKSLERVNYVANFRITVVVYFFSERYIK